MLNSSKKKSLAKTISVVFGGENHKRRNSSKKSTNNTGTTDVIEKQSNYRNSWHCSAGQTSENDSDEEGVVVINKHLRNNSTSSNKLRKDSLTSSTPSMNIGGSYAPKNISPLTRNHSLKYSGGALHTANPVSFDHNFGMSWNKSDGPPPQTTVVRSQSVRLPPLVRLQNNSSEKKCDSIPRSRPIVVKRRANSISEDEDEVPTIYCTPPHTQTNFLGVPESLISTGATCTGRTQNLIQNECNISKSRSMTNLSNSSSSSSNAFPAVLMSDARSRSYLLGSVGPTSLLGAEELERYFPDRNLRVFVGTWNMNGVAPPRHLADFLLPENLEYVPDLLVIGTQETFPERHEWEVRLQDTLGPSHILYHSQSLGTLHLTVFLRRDLIWFCSVPDVDSFSTRPGAQFKTKGAVAIAFLIFGTSFLFVNSHLTAHEENVKDRIKDLKKINAMLNLPKNLPVRKKYTNPCENFDVVFWCGDLNFRLETSRDIVIRQVEDGRSVLEFDQLNFLRLEAGLIFKGFEECHINFLPTYKYDSGSNEFDTSSKQRTPSYTDRILYKANSSSVRPLHYDSVQDVLTSDHKPVWGMWEVKLRPGKDSIPLAGGLFNRDVYLEGLKRRSEALQPSLRGKNSHNNICNMQ